MASPGAVVVFVAADSMADFAAAASVVSAEAASVDSGAALDSVSDLADSGPAIMTAGTAVTRIMGTATAIRIIHILMTDTVMVGTVMASMADTAMVRSAVRLLFAEAVDGTTSANEWHVADRRVLL